MLSQFFGVFVGENVLGEETGIGFEMGKAWHVFTGNIPLSIMMALLFPFSVLALNWKDLRKNGAFRLAWQMMAAKSL